METLLSDLMAWVHAHPHWAGLFVLVVSALESFLVVGLIVPGTVVMFGIGAMIAAGSMQLLPTLLFAAVGAVLGDGTSYFIGRHYHQRLRVMWPFRKYPQMITRGVDFFHQHGGKSILMARFVGPVRPLLPAVAGMLDMPARRFFLFNTLSALIWAPAYILPGVLFGASLGVAAEIAGHLALLLGLLVLLLWFSWWLVRRLTRSLQPHAHALQLRVLDWSRGHRWLHPLAASLLDPQHPEARGMTVLTLLLLAASWSLLALLPGNLSPAGGLGNLDLYLYYQLQSLRGPLGDQLMVFISGLGSGWVLYGFSLLMSLWLLWYRHWRVTVHWLVTIAAVSAMTALLKYYTQVPRPPAWQSMGMSYSFPGDHAGLSLAVFGFLAVAIARELRSNWHWVPYSSAVFLVVAIGFARLYLGVQWFSDILAGWSLGLLWVALLGIAYRQHPAEHIPSRVFAPVALAALAVTAGLYTSQQFSTQLAFYKPVPGAEIPISRQHWLQGGWRELPVYRDDFAGQHHHPLDVQWLGSREAIETTLRARGWRSPPHLSSSSLLDLLNSGTGLDELPVLPQVHQGETQQILLVRASERRPGHLLTLRLWQTEYRLAGATQRLWIGSVSYLFVDERLRVIHFLRTSADYRAPLREFIPWVADLKHSLRQHDAQRLQPSVSRWGGRVLLIDGG